MRGGWIGAFVASCLLLFAAVARGEGELLFVDGERITLAASRSSDEEGLLVPLREFGYLVGVEVSDGAGGTVILRWRSGRRTLQAAQLPVFEGRLFVSLEWLVELSGGVLRRLGSATYVETEPVSMSELDVSEDRTVLRFDGFVPVEIVAIDGASFLLRFHHCVAPFPHHSVVLGSGPMTRVEVQSTAADAMELSVTLREIGALRLRRFEAEGFFSVTVEVGSEPLDESVIEIGNDIRLHEAEVSLTAGSTRVAYVRIEDWRTRYRFRPAFAPSGLGGVASLDLMARESAAAAGIGVACDPELLVLDGVPYCLAAEDVNVLAFDAFGRLSDLRTSGTAVLNVEGSEIRLDGVNRPIRYGEAIAYPPGYTGEIAQGVPGAVVVLKLRSGRVVSVHQGAFVDQDPTATLIVASGEACSRFSGITLGDDALLECHTASGGEGPAPVDEPLLDAVTIDFTLLQDGLDVAADDGETSSARAWSLIATDWHGGLTLLSICRDERSAGATIEEVRALLRGFPVPVQDAFVLNSGGSNSLLVRDRGYHELGGGDRVAVGLLVVSIAE